MSRAVNDDEDGEWGLFLDEDQAEDLLSLARAFNCAANMLTGDDKAVVQGDVVDLFRQFARRIEDIVGDNLPSALLTGAYCPI